MCCGVWMLPRKHQTAVGAGSKPALHANHGLGTIPIHFFIDHEKCFGSGLTIGGRFGTRLYRIYSNMLVQNWAI